MEAGVKPKINRCRRSLRLQFHMPKMGFNVVYFYRNWHSFRLWVFFSYPFPLRSFHGKQRRMPVVNSGSLPPELFSDHDAFFLFFLQRLGVTPLRMFPHFNHWLHFSASS